MSEEALSGAKRASEGERGRGGESSTSSKRAKAEGLPQTSIRRIMRINSAVTSVGAEAIAATARATELFIAYLVEESAKKAVEDGGRTLLKIEDINSVIENNEKLEFLKDAFGPPREL